MAMTQLRSATPDAGDLCMLVGKALEADRFDLDEFPVLSEVPGIERFAVAHPHALLPRGKALQLLLTRAVTEVSTVYAEDGGRTLRKIAANVRLRYQDKCSVKDIAEAWGFDRTVLSRQLSRCSLQVVSHRFLQLAEHMRWDKGEAAAPSSAR
jgi:hypothetical protein